MARKWKGAVDIKVLLLFRGYGFLEENFSALLSTFKVFYQLYSEHKHQVQVRSVLESLQVQSV